MRYNLKKVNDFINYLGLSIIVLAFFGYLLGGKLFAEIHLSFSFLNFPIFIGEIFIFLCSIIFFIKIAVNYRNFVIKTRPVSIFAKNNWGYLLLIFYFGFVFIKALSGYFKWGPLALRHAALFYYPVFAVFSYGFSQKTFFTTKKYLFSALLLMTIVILLRFNEYFSLTCFALIFISVINCSNKQVKYLLLLITSILFISRLGLFFYTSRTFLVANVTALLFIFSTLSWFILNIKKKYKIIVIIAIFIIILGVILKFGERHSTESIVRIKTLIRKYQEYNNVILKEKDEFEPVELSVKLYNPELPFDLFESIISDHLTVAENQIKELKNEIAEQFTVSGEMAAVTEEKVKEAERRIENILRNILAIEEEVSSALPLVDNQRLPPIEELLLKIKRMRGELLKLRTDLITKDYSEYTSKQYAFDKLGRMNNSLFRLFIWRDMLKEFFEKKPILGFHFGKPFRSKSLEILGWGRGDWLRDGWISAHNSYIQAIYNSGFLGIICILFVLGQLIQMIRSGIFFKSITGILLCGILVNWFVAANFSVILELPYNAIPIWIIYGIAFAYIRNLKNKHLNP